jgi:Carboxypeptidase regulatory-like domain
MKYKSTLSFCATVAQKTLFAFFFTLLSVSAFAQVTTSSITGEVTDKAGEGLIGATVIATHVPSGTRYGATTNAVGRYTMPAVRVGGPFTIVVSYTGYETQTKNDINTSLGTAANADFKMAEAGALIETVTITDSRNDVFSSNRTGAAQTLDKQTLQTVPIIGGRSINGLTRYNPNGNGSSFGGQDSRLNSFTIDGSTFNNGFGLGNDAFAGGRTGTTPISLDAIEEFQVNIAPFDVRQSGFVGAGLNAVTRSGNNDFSGSVYRNWRNTGANWGPSSEEAKNRTVNNAAAPFRDRLLFFGTESNGRPVVTRPDQFNEELWGVRIGGPIVKDKVFFFANYESQNQSAPAQNFAANGSSSSGQTSRATVADLDRVSQLLRDRFGYETGPYDGYSAPTESRKFLVRLDFNLSEKHKLTTRYTHHNSDTYVVISNSNSVGFGNRYTVNAMSYENSGYFLKDNTRSGVIELNSTLSDKLHNNLIVGYDYQNEDRAYPYPTQYAGQLFPTIDILSGNQTYISAGMDPFTPSNKLNYSTFHITNNASLYLGKHTLTAGARFERYKSNNLFFPGSNAAFVYPSLADFERAMAGTRDSVVLFQYRYSALPGGAEPLQVLTANRFDLYAQDDIQLTNRFKVLVGLRAGLIALEQTGLENPVITAQNYINLDERTGYKVNTSLFPKANVLLEPRLGFNWDVKGDKKTQVRGGTGIFTGRPPYVWISNQIGNNGVLTGFIEERNTTRRRFSPNATDFTPANPTLPTTFDIAATDPSYRFPQVWKSNLAVDQKLGPLVLSAEFLFNKNINAAQYFDANIEPATRTFSGPDQRPRFPGSGVASGTALNNAIRINDNVTRAAVLTTTNQGDFYSLTFKVEYPRQKGLYAMAAYTRSRARDLMTAGSIAAGSYTGARSVNGNNNLDLAFSNEDAPHRFVGLMNYRIAYGKGLGGATTFSLGYVGAQNARITYTIAGDMNGDGIPGNDLLFVPNNASELTFTNLTIGTGTAARTFTPAQQAEAFEAFIRQDPYLSTRRGKYAERNGGILPMLHRFDLGVAQDFVLPIAGKPSAFQVRLDILNAGNILNNEWGTFRAITGNVPLSFVSVSAEGVPTYRIATQTLLDGTTNMLQNTYIPRFGNIADVWTAQMSIRYTFN